AGKWGARPRHASSAAGERRRSSRPARLWNRSSRRGAEPGTPASLVAEFLRPLPADLHRYAVLARGRELPAADGLEHRRVQDLTRGFDDVQVLGAALLVDQELDADLAEVMEPLGRLGIAGGLTLDAAGGRC